MVERKSNMFPRDKATDEQDIIQNQLHAMRIKNKHKCGSCVTYRKMQLLYKFGACFLFAPHVTDFILFLPLPWFYLSGTYFFNTPKNIFFFG